MFSYHSTQNHSCWPLLALGVSAQHKPADFKPTHHARTAPMGQKCPGVAQSNDRVKFIDLSISIPFWLLPCRMEKRLRG